jgi:hypothetical protein
MILRPSKVPRAARYSLRDGWWQVGNVVEGKPVGAWTTWRQDGSPLFTASFDSKGRLQGAFKRFHPDGSLAREARYSKGKPVGKHVLYRAKGSTDDVFPSADPRAWQLALLFEAGKESSRTPLDERGAELVEDRAEGAAPVAGVLDPVFASAQPDGFLASGLLPRILSTFEAAGAAPVDRFLWPRPAKPRRPLDAKRFQDLYGMPMPASLKAWFDTFATEPALFGMRIARDADLATPGNLVEALILEHQEAPGRSDGLYAMVSGLIPIGTSTDGRLRYCAAICEAPDAPTDAVYPLNLRDDAIQIPVARTLDDWAYAVTLLTAVERAAIGTSVQQPAFARLRGRIDLRPPMLQLATKLLDEEDDEVTGDPAGDHAEGFWFRRGNCVPGYFFYRNRWLLRLLCGNAEGAAAIYQPAQSMLDDARFERICKHAAQPWVSFYWAFWMLAFEDERLSTYLSVAADSPSQLTRDVAALVKALLEGRTQLGSVEDFPAVLAAFRALDPASNTEDDEEEEEEEEEEDEDGDEEEGEEGEGDDEGAEAAAAIPDPRAAAVLAWANNAGYERENLIIKYELDVAALGLALRADPAILPHVAAIVDDNPWLGSRLLAPWIDGDRGDLAAIAPAARAWLLDREAGAVYRWMVAARLLARVGTPADGKLIADVLEPSLDQMFGRGMGFEAAMSTMVLEEAIEVLCDAIQKLGISETVIAALEGVASADSHLVDDSRGPCALALASVKRGLDPILSGIKGQVDRKHGHRITSEQLEALGRLGEPERTAEIRAVLESIAKPSDDAKLGLALALHDLGIKPIDVTALLREALGKKRYQDDREDAAKKRAAVLAIVGRRSDVPAELAAPYVHSPHPVLQLAAIRVLRDRGAPIPAIDLWDPYRISELDRDQLHAALAARTGLHLGNIALWIVDHPDESSREPLIAFARSLVAEAARTKQPFPSEGPRHYELYWTIYALIQLGGAEKLFDELLLADDREVCDAVLRYCERLGPQIARGMVHVFTTDKHWRQATARDWLKKRKSDPRIAAALAELGLAIEDVTRKPKEEA